MARETIKPVPTMAAIDAHLASGNVAAAVVAARQLYLNQPHAEHLAQYQRVLVAEAQAAIDAKNLPVVVSVLAAMAKLPPSEFWTRQRAIVLAKSGQCGEALALLPGDAKTILAHAADHAVRHQRFKALPPEQHAAVEAILAAFAAYEKGADDLAKEKLQAVVLTSPLLEWKILLRGLMAFTAGEDAQAVENWKRLDPVRLPARLAAPLRAKLDAAVPATPPLIARAAKLWSSREQDKLRSALAVVGGTERLSRGWDRIEAAWDALAGHDDLRERFADAVYHAIFRQGQPEDLKTYRKLFGPPPQDPDFHRLQAMVLENQDYTEMAIAFWEKYEAWLATKPAAWPAAQIPRARAMVLERLALLSDAVHDSSDIMSELQRMVAMFEKRPLPVPPSPAKYFERGRTADRTSVSIREAYLKYKIDTEEYDGLAVLAHETLLLDAANLTAHRALAVARREEGDYQQALAARLKALSVNPLDNVLGVEAARSALSAIRVLAATNPADAEALSQQHRELCERHFAFEYPLVALSLDRKLGRMTALPETSSPIAQAFLLSVDAALMKLKPAAKTAANKLFTERSTQPAKLDDVLILHVCAGTYGNERFDYRGAKSMRKKVDTLIEKACETETSEAAIQRLMVVLLGIDNPKFTVALCERLMPRFPDLPHVKYNLATALFAMKRPNRTTVRRIATLLMDARIQAERRGDAGLIEQIDAVRAEMARDVDDLYPGFGGMR